MNSNGNDGVELSTFNKPRDECIAINFSKSLYWKAIDWLELHDFERVCYFGVVDFDTDKVIELTFQDSTFIDEYCVGTAMDSTVLDLCCRGYIQ